ncbi:MAG: hypothetical protein ACK46C_11045 [Flavobacteriales bacterium]
MVVMKRILTWGAWIYIAVSLVLTLIISMTELEFANNELETKAQGLLMFGISGCIGLLLLCRIDANDPLGLKLLRVFGAGAASFVFLVVFGYVGFLVTSMCAWSERKSLFVHRKDPERRIVIRDYGCGATDSSPPIVRTFDMVRLNSWFNYVGDVDTAELDDSDWIPANDLN